MQRLARSGRWRSRVQRFAENLQIKKAREKTILRMLSSYLKDQRKGLLFAFLEVARTKGAHPNYFEKN